MKRKVVFLVGLPGSGKTHYLKTHAEKYKNYIILDDTSVSQTRTSLQKLITDAPRLVISDPLLCNFTRRNSAEHMVGDADITWIYFSNDPESCLNNIYYRKDGRKISPEYVWTLARGYNIPDGSTIIPVYRVEGVIE